MKNVFSLLQLKTNLALLALLAAIAGGVSLISVHVIRQEIREAQAQKAAEAAALRQQLSGLIFNAQTDLSSLQGAVELLTFNEMQKEEQLSALGSQSYYDTVKSAQENLQEKSSALIQDKKSLQDFVDMHQGFVASLPETTKQEVYRLANLDIQQEIAATRRNAQERSAL